MNSPSQQRTIDEFYEWAENVMMYGTKEANLIKKRKNMKPYIMSIDVSSIPEGMSLSRFLDAVKISKMPNLFTEDQLVSFGNYLLSDKRQDLINSLPNTSIEDRVEAEIRVSDADVANWKGGNIDWSTIPLLEE